MYTRTAVAYSDEALSRARARTFNRAQTISYSRHNNNSQSSYSYNTTCTANGQFAD